MNRSKYITLFVFIGTLAMVFLSFTVFAITALENNSFTDENIVEVYNNGHKHEIKIDAITGEINSYKSKRTQAPRTRSGLYAAEVTSVRAIKLAETAVAQANGGTVSEIEWERKNGVLICGVEVSNDRRKHETKFNAATGEIIRKSR
jgi:uncharacterized membrane protein YkoI